MSYVLIFFQWIYGIIKKAAQWVTGLGGSIILFITTFFSTVAGSVSYVVDHFSYVAQMFGYGTEKVQSVAQYTQGNETFSLLSYSLSLDVAFDYLISLGGVFLGCVGFIIIALFAYVVTALIIPLIFNVVLKIISLFSAGFVKP